jgi:hypothetical protein
MAAHIKKELFPASVIGSDTTTVGEAFHLHAHAKEIIIESVVSSRTDGTFTLTLQHSPDGINWTNVLMSDGSTAFATAAQSADGREYKYLLQDAPIYPHVRASILSSAVTTGATVEVNLHHGVQR